MGKVKPPSGFKIQNRKALEKNQFALIRPLSIVMLFGITALSNAKPN